jgi:UDP-N-acetylmuramoylalanine--D-glutamate ligase
LFLHNNKKRIVILGGISKSDSFKNLMIKDDDIILIYGRDKEKIFNELEKGLMFDTLNQIVEYIKQYLNDDIYILFTPGCSSFDQFNNYIERGETFLRLIGECHD